MINYEKEYNNLCNCYRRQQGIVKALLEACKKVIILITEDLKGLSLTAPQLLAANLVKNKVEQAIAKAEDKG